MGHKIATGRQIADLARLAVRLTADEFNRRKGWLEKLTNPEFDLTTISIDGLQPITLGSGYVFTVDEVLELEVDYSISPDEILARGGYNLHDWNYLGTRPESGTRRVRAVIGRLNKRWSEEKVAELLKEPDCPMKGSGAWVREAFMKTRPRYDRKGGIGFPDPVSSRWRRQDQDEGVYFPDLWLDDGDWRRNLYWAWGVWYAERRLCLLLGNHTRPHFHSFTRRSAGDSFLNCYT